MAEFDLIGRLLASLPDYGAQLLAVVALCCALGVPLPMPVLVLATGALVREGSVPFHLAAAACLAGSLCGESIFYLTGRYAGAWVHGHAGTTLSAAWQKTQQQFMAQAARTVYLTRWLLTPLGIPTSLVAGSQRYAYWRFALCAVAGDLMWVLGYGVAGYALGPQWPAVTEFMGRYGNPVAVATIGATVCYYLQAQVRTKRVCGV